MARHDKELLILKPVRLIGKSKVRMLIVRRHQTGGRIKMFSSKTEVVATIVIVLYIISLFIVLLKELGMLKI
jgi:hypothetical protein